MDCNIAVSKQLAALSPKQRAVLYLVARHHTTKEIARKLQLSPHTVEQRIQTLRTRFGAVPRRELGRLYTELENAYAGNRGSSSHLSEQPPFADSEAIGFLKRLENGIGSKKWTFFAGFLTGMMIGLGVALIAVVSTFLILTS